MTIALSNSILSGLGFSSDENFDNVIRGVSGLGLIADRYPSAEPFMASEIDCLRLEDEFANASAKYRGAKSDYTKLEKAAIVSVAKALLGCSVDAASERTLFVLSTTKGNIDEIHDARKPYLWHSASLVARFFGNKNQPVVISNACISGASALIAAQRALKAKRYDYVIVTGVDVISEFIIAGFQSFKALSQEVCKPFDANRTGLNIGEAAATIILTKRDVKKGDVAFVKGAVRNDANHISGPSRTGEGAYLALKNVCASDLAFINAHGTATPYNDEMESVALTRAGLHNVPVNSLKGYFGHTLGAAGVLESIISIKALIKGVIPATHGFETSGVTYPIPIVKTPQKTNKTSFIKMLSGFGGCNAALLFTYHN
jgi:3-oxoacyl-[acyl-carrier-protein] synthase-1